MQKQEEKVMDVQSQNENEKIRAKSNELYDYLYSEPNNTITVSSKEYIGDVDVERFEVVTTAEEVYEIGINLTIHDGNDNTKTISIKPKDAVRLAKTLEDYARYLACKYLDYLKKEETEDAQTDKKSA